MKTLKLPARVNKVAPHKQIKGAGFNHELASIVFDPDYFEKRGKKAAARKRAREDWAMRKAEKAARDTRQDMNKRFGPV